MAVAARAHASDRDMVAGWLSLLLIIELRARVYLWYSACFRIMRISEVIFERTMELPIGDRGCEEVRGS